MKNSGGDRPVSKGFIGVSFPSTVRCIPRSIPLFIHFLLHRLATTDLFKGLIQFHRSLHRFSGWINQRSNRWSTILAATSPPVTHFQSNRLLHQSLFTGPSPPVFLKYSRAGTRPQPHQKPWLYVGFDFQQQFRHNFSQQRYILPHRILSGLH